MMLAKPVFRGTLALVMRCMSLSLELTLLALILEDGRRRA